MIGGTFLKAFEENPDRVFFDGHHVSGDFRIRTRFPITDESIHRPDPRGHDCPLIANYTTPPSPLRKRARKGPRFFVYVAL